MTAGPLTEAAVNAGCSGNNDLSMASNRERAWGHVLTWVQRESGWPAGERTKQTIFPKKVQSSRKR